jgi:hypothetical protein
MVGLELESGRFPGRMKFAGLGCTPKALVMLGELKSSIWKRQEVSLLERLEKSTTMVAAAWHTDTHV